MQSKCRIFLQFIVLPEPTTPPQYGVALSYGPTIVPPPNIGKVIKYVVVDHLATLTRHVELVHDAFSHFAAVSVSRVDIRPTLFIRGPHFL